MKLWVLAIDLPEWKEVDDAQRAYWDLDVDNKDVSEDVVQNAINRIQVAKRAWIMAAARLAEQTEAQ